MDRAEVYYVDTSKLRVYRNESQNLCASIEGRGSWQKLIVRFAFPYFEPRKFVSLATADEEIGIIRDLEHVDAQSRRILEETLEKRYHIPEILRVSSIQETREGKLWMVETNRGMRSFVVRSPDDFVRVKGGSVIVVDADENRFCIPDLHSLDTVSRRSVEMYY